MDLKSKYLDKESTTALCIEAEIFPLIDEKIQKKVFQKVDAKIQKLNDTMVKVKVFEYKSEELNQKINDTKDA